MRRLILFALIVVIPVVVFFYSLKKSYYQCDGNFDGESKKSTLYLKVAENRWWVQLWSDNDGRIDLEIPNNAYQGYSIKRVGDQFQLFDGDKLRGNFSLISYNLLLIRDPKPFEGICKQLERRD